MRKGRCCFRRRRQGGFAGATWLGGIALALIACWLLPQACSIAFGQEAPKSYPAPTFLPPAGHPRVYFRAADIPKLRENTLKPQNAMAWAEFQKNLEAGTDGALPTPTDGTGNCDARVLLTITCHAYDYALHGNKSNGRRAVDALKNYLRTVVYPPNDYNNTGQTVYAIGVVYDWCYPLMSAGDRDLFFRAAIETAEKMEIGWPPVRQRNVTGHGPEGQIFRDLLAVSIAMYDEHPEMYAWVGGRFFSRMVEPREFMYAGHMHHQGVHYCNYRGQWEMLATWVFDRMGLPQVFGPEQRYFMYWTLYARRGDGLVLRDGDTHMNNRPAGEYWASPFRTMFLAANYFSDPYLKMEASRQRPNFQPTTSRSNQAADCVEMLIFNNPDLEPRPLDELPLSKYFPSPKGAMIARTGWQDGPNSPAVVAEMKINEWYFANHQHLDAGAFQIYYRGVLANDSGYYQAGVNKVDEPGNNGSSGYGSFYDVNYHKRSIAHNVMLVIDPDERFDSRRWSMMTIANDGGQRMPNRWQEPTEQEEFLDPKNAYRIGEVLGRGFGPDPKVPEYTYLKGDLARAYSAKIKGYERSFVFLNLARNDVPAAMIVFDRVQSSNPSFRKAWLLHGLEAPSVVGNRTVLKDTRKGYTGKLTVDTLLPAPENASITAVGGPGKEAFYGGVNYEAKLRPDGVNEGHGWRIEVSPKAPSATDLFLNVMQVSDHAPADVPALPVTPISAETHTGARVADRVVMFGRQRDRARAPVAFTVPGEGSAKVLVADLEAGAWRVERAGGAITSVMVSGEEGTAYFIAEPGRCTLVRSPE